MVFMRSYKGCGIYGASERIQEKRRLKSEGVRRMFANG